MELIGIVLGAELLRKEPRISGGSIGLDNTSVIAAMGLVGSTLGHYQDS